MLEFLFMVSLSCQLNHISNWLVISFLRNTEVEAFEDLPLEEPFMENDYDAVVDSSDSDGYLSEVSIFNLAIICTSLSTFALSKLFVTMFQDISYENGTESEPGKLLEGS